MATESRDIKMESNSELRMDISISDPSVDPETIEEWARRLKDDLFEIGYIHVEFLKDEKPYLGSKGLDPVVAGTIYAILLANMLPKALDFIHEWVISRESRSVKIKLQSKKGSAIEVEIPASMSKEAANEWISTIRKQLPD